MQNTKKAVRADLICKNVPHNAQEHALMDASPSADCSLNAPAVTDSRNVASIEKCHDGQFPFWLVHFPSGNVERFDSEYQAKVRLSDYNGTSWKH